MPEKTSVKSVGGTRAEDGPWPDDVSEIVEGEQYDRDVNGTVLTVTITEVKTTNYGTTVSYTYGGSN